MNDHIKRSLLYFLICSLLVSSFVNVSVLGDDTEYCIEYTINLDSFTIQHNNGYDDISCTNFGRLLVEGKPNLPSKIISIAVPPKAIVQELTFITSDCVRLEGYFRIEPCPSPLAIDKYGPSDAQQQIYDSNYMQTYLTNEPYPSQRGEYVRNSHYRKYDLIDIRINPFTYYPLSKVLEYYPTITVVVKYSMSEESHSALSDNLSSKELVAEQIICNYQQAKEWYPTSDKDEGGLYDFVIITLDSLVDAVQPLVEWEMSKQRNVNVVTTSWIATTYNGYDLQEKIRNFLREKYLSSEWGISDVLLVGHYDDIPLRRCAQDMGNGQPETDYYYAELSLPDNESWDADEDHKYGENSDPIDFYAEVNVGRIPSSNVSCVTYICNKSVFYEQANSASYKENILLLGAYYWSDTDNAVLMEEIASQPWMTNWTMTRMYEQPQSSYPSDYNLNYDNVRSNWSSSTYGFVNWAGHGSPTAAYEYYPSQPFVDTNTCASLNDTYSAIVFAASCSNHDADQYNIGQAMMQRGAVGFLGATEVAYGMPGWNDPYDGSTQSLDYFFTTSVTSCNYSTGQAHQWALIEMYTNGLWYYDYLETFEWGAYLGNPDIWMNVSPMLSYAPTSYDLGIIDSNYTYSINFEIWNNGSGNLHYELFENCEWIEIYPLDGVSSGEHDIITVTINTTDLTPGGYHFDILISTEEAGKGLLPINLYIPSGDELLDIEQISFDRGFPIRHTLDGDWAAAQSLIPTISYMARAEILLRKFGTPEFDLCIELRTESPMGSLLQTSTYSSTNISSDWNWISIDLIDFAIMSGTEYFIVIPPAPSGVTTSFGYEWGYAFGNLYDGGSFWFTRNSGDLWRDLPTMYDFAFRIFGY